MLTRENTTLGHLVFLVDVLLPAVVCEASTVSTQSWTRGDAAIGMIRGCRSISANNSREEKGLAGLAEAKALDICDAQTFVTRTSATSVKPPEGPLLQHKHM